MKGQRLPHLLLHAIRLAFLTNQPPASVVHHAAASWTA
jgi:hypothetical protein